MEKNIQNLIDYHVKDFLIQPTLFQQVYEEITTFAYWLKGFKPNNILEVGFEIFQTFFDSLSVG